MSSWRCSGGLPGRPTSRSGGRAPRPSLKEFGRFPACTCRSCSKSLSAALRSQFLPGLGREEQFWSLSASKETEPFPKHLCRKLFQPHQLHHPLPSLFFFFSSWLPPSARLGISLIIPSFSIPSRRSLASPGSAPVERTKSDRTMSIAEARRSQWHWIGSSASIWG